MTYAISNLHGYSLEKLKRLLEKANFLDDDFLYILGNIIDWFGGGVTFFDETDKEVSVRVRVNFAVMRRWALQYALHAKILSPKSLAG